MWDWRNSMEKKKKIALLNLPVDGNYGGQLQRYALITIMQRLGYEVMHLNLRAPNSKKPFWKYVKGGIKQFIVYLSCVFSGKRNTVSLKYLPYFLKRESITEAFYDKHIPHTSRICSKAELAKYNDFDYYVVGSDQVWRKAYLSIYDTGMWFFDFVPDNNHAKRIAYGASFGVSEKEFNEEDISTIGSLYQKFYAVSVREDSGLSLLKEYGLISPKAEVVLDPTLLLTANDYIVLYSMIKTKPLINKLLCYVLDMDEEKERVIDQIANEKHLQPYIITMNNNANLSVEQWVRNFSEAEYVVTDSYHGLLFSLIFHKPFKLIINESRGAARFESVGKQLGFTIKEPIDWKLVDANLENARNKSIRFLKNVLTSK